MDISGQAGGGRTGGEKTGKGLPTWAQDSSPGQPRRWWRAPGQREAAAGAEVGLGGLLPYARHPGGQQAARAQRLLRLGGRRVGKVQERLGAQRLQMFGRGGSELERAGVVWRGWSTREAGCVRTAWRLSNTTQQLQAIAPCRAPRKLWWLGPRAPTCSTAGGSPPISASTQASRATATDRSLAFFDLSLSFSSPPASLPPSLCPLPLLPPAAPAAAVAPPPAAPPSAGCAAAAAASASARCACCCFSWSAAMMAACPSARSTPASSWAHSSMLRSTRPACKDRDRGRTERHTGRLAQSALRAAGGPGRLWGLTGGAKERGARRGNALQQHSWHAPSASTRSRHGSMARGPEKDVTAKLPRRCRLTHPASAHGTLSIAHHPQPTQAP